MRGTPCMIRSMASRSRTSCSSSSLRQRVELAAVRGDQPLGGAARFLDQVLALLVADAKRSL